MKAYVECGVCGQRLTFDTGTPVDPRVVGWSESQLSDVSIDAYINWQNEMVPICPDCQERHIKILEMFDPFKTKIQK